MILTSDKLEGNDVQRANDVCTVTLSYEAIAKLLELPVGARIVGAADIFNRNAVSFKIVGMNHYHKNEGVEIINIIPTENNRWHGDPTV